MVSNNYYQQGFVPAEELELLANVAANLAEIAHAEDLRMEEEHLDEEFLALHSDQMSISPPLPSQPIEPSTPAYNSPAGNDSAIIGTGSVQPPMTLQYFEPTTPTYDDSTDNDTITNDADISQPPMTSQSTGLDEPASPSIYDSAISDADDSPQRSVSSNVAETQSRKPHPATPHPKTLPPITRMKLGPGSLQSIVESPLRRSTRIKKGQPLPTIAESPLSRSRHLSSPASTSAKHINASPRPTKRKSGKSLTPVRDAKRARSRSSSAKSARSRSQKRSI